MKIMIDITEHEWEYLNKLVENGDQLGHYERLLVNGNVLEQEPKTDCISRESVIKALNTMDRYVSEELTLCDTNKKFPTNEVFVVDDVYEEIVERLPSVKQEPKTGCCRECKHWKDSDGVYRRGHGAESICPINTKVVHDGEGYCYLFSKNERGE